jgi:hypothetical protein
MGVKKYIGLLFCASCIQACSGTSAPDTNIHVAETARYSIRKNFHIESSGSYSDSLAPIYPNPFNHNAGDSNVTLFFTTRDTGEVKIIIQNPIGDSVVIYQDSMLLPGIYIGYWGPLAADGTRLRAGLYFITMRAAPNDPNRNYINSRLLDIQSND